MIMYGNNVSYIKAYTEVNCLLEYLPQTYVDKIPKKFIDLIKRQTDEQYNIKIDINKSLMEQGFSKKTKDLIAVINYNYWSTDEEKKILKQKFYENENKYQEELKEKYNPNNLFKNKAINKEEIATENVSMVEYKESFIRKIINKIKSLLFKSNK